MSRCGASNGPTNESTGRELPELRCARPVPLVERGTTVCPFCHSILVRGDLDLKKVGQVAELPPDPSPISLLTEGTYRGKSFQVIGRILYEWEDGGWNEWHIVFSDGSSGWLSDAQLEYAVSFLVSPAPALPGQSQIARGKQFEFNQTTYEVATVTQASYKGVEGGTSVPFLRQVEHVVRGFANARRGSEPSTSAIRRPRIVPGRMGRVRGVNSESAAV